MSLNLTPEERKYANRYLDYLKMSRRWLYGRYIIMALFIAAMAFFLLHFEKLREESKNIMSLRLRSSAPSEIEEYVRSIIKKKSQNNAERTMNALSCYFTLFCLIYAGYQWNRHLRDSIISKILREKLDEERSTESSDEIKKEQGQ